MLRTIWDSITDFFRSLIGAERHTDREDVFAETGYTQEELDRIKREFAREREQQEKIEVIEPPEGAAEERRKGWRDHLQTLLSWLKPKLKLEPIDKYVFREVASYFLIGFIGFTIFMMVTQVFILSDKIFGKHIPLMTTLTVLMLYTPSLLIFSIPVATLFGTLMGIGRLNRDHETTAMFTSGVSLYRLFLPFLCFGIWAALATFIVTDYVVPHNNKQAGDIMTVFFDSQVADFIKPGVVISAPDRRYFYVERVDDQSNQLYNLRVYDYAGQRPAPRIFLSQVAEVENKYLKLDDVRVYESDTQDGHYIASAISPGTSIDISRKIDPQNYRIESVSLTAQELQERIQDQRETISERKGEPPDWMRYNLNKDLTDYHLKYSIPVAAIVFVMVAVPLGLTGPRDERNMGVIISFVLMMVYYALYFGFRQLGYDGFLQGVYAAWVPIVLYGVVGVWLLWRART